MKFSMMVDSGAFSAFTQNKVINLENYCKFILDNRKHIDVPVSLDMINPQDPNVAAAEGMKNFLEMKSRGIDDALPVFHARESTKWLDQMIDLTDGYVGISASSLVSPVEARSWLRICWEYITDKNGFPIVRTHSFGDTSAYSLLSMPFFSADSATWIIQAAKAARIKLKGKAFQFRSHSINDVNYIADTDTGLKRESWEMELRELGLCPDAAMKLQGKGSTLAMLRCFLVASDLLKLKEQTKYVTKYLQIPTLINTKKQQEGGTEKEGPVKLYFVISPSAYTFSFPIIRALGIKDILLSYYYIHTAQKGYWEDIMLPFMEDPDDFCERNVKTRKFRDQLDSCLLNPVNPKSPAPTEVLPPGKESVSGQIAEGLH